MNTITTIRHIDVCGGLEKIRIEKKGARPVGVALFLFWCGLEGRSDRASSGKDFARRCVGGAIYAAGRGKPAPTCGLAPWDFAVDS
jgi:hypothetical protein